MVPGALSADPEEHEGEWVCLECEELTPRDPALDARDLQ
jgi:hypothetical protein